MAGNFDEDSAYQRAETKFDEGRGGRAKVRRRPGGSTKGEGVRRRPIQKAKTKPEKNAKVRRRLNEGRRFDEGHRGREGGSTKAKSFDEG